MSARVRLVALAGLMLALLPACSAPDRPEGVVERWLISLNSGAAGRPEQYAPDALSQRILPNWANRDPGDLDVIEVGKGRHYETLQIGPKGTAHQAEVPFRFERTDGELGQRVALLNERSGDWRVVALLPPGTAGLSVPTHGGERIGDAALSAWLVALGAAAGFCLLAMALMSTIGRPRRPTPTAG